MSVDPSYPSNFGLNFDDLRPRVHFGTAERMDALADGSVDLVVTSPPYGTVKDYGAPEQIGFSDSFGRYFRRLATVWRECFRVLKPGRRMAVNVGDQYLRASEHGRYRVLPIASRVVVDCEAAGFDFLGDVIWQKVSTTNTTGGCSFMGSIFYPRNGLVTYDYEHVLIFKKPGKSGWAGERAAELREYSKIPLDEWKRWFVGHWQFPGVRQVGHEAQFPGELPHRLVRMFSVVGDVVLDPFVGSGTTLKVAWSLLRRSVGYEVNESFAPVVEKKLAEASPRAFRDYQYFQNWLSSRAGLGGADWAYDFEFSSRKGVTCLLERATGKRVAVEYLWLPDGLAGARGDLGREEEKEFDRVVRHKLAENSAKNFLHGRGGWKLVEKFVVLVNFDGSVPGSEVDPLLDGARGAFGGRPGRAVTFDDYDDVVAQLARGDGPLRRWFE
ncbi:MAG: hypothetical protein Kow0069_08580 [Promethearchaeota archaeon]